MTGDDSTWEGSARPTELTATVEQQLADSRSEGTQSAERLLRSIVDSLDGRMCIIAADLRILGSNMLWNETFPQAAVRFGGGPDGPDAGAEVNLSLVLEQLPLPLQQAIKEAVQQVVKGDVSHCDVKGEWYRIQGREDVVVRVHKVREHDQARAVLVMVDITESLRTRERLRRVTEQAHLLALVAQHMDNAVFILDPKGSIEWVNDAFTRTTGYKRAELVGLSSEELARTLVGEVNLEAFAVRLEADESGDLECRALRRDGTPYRMELRIQPLRERGRPDRRIGVLRDVTERRLAEEQVTASKQQAEALAGELSTEKVLLAKVLNAIPHLVYWKDATLRYDGVNDAFLTVRECGPAQGVLGLREAELGRKDALSELLPPLERQVLDDGEGVENVRVTLTGSSGPPRQLFLTVLPQTDEDGAVTGVIGVAADVTQLSHLEQQLAQATRLEAIGQLAAGVAHEINTPVQFVSDNVRFVADCFGQVLPALRHLAEPADDAEQSALARESVMKNLDLEFIIDEVPSALSQSLEGLSRVAEIVRAMKDFSHPGGERTATDLNRAIESTIQVSRNEWKYVAECEVRLDPEVGIVPCFEGEIKQAVLNLIVNSAQAVAEYRQRSGLAGLGHLEVVSRRERDVVVIEVADDGPGMSEEIRARIFDPFFTTKEVGKGTGQGLSMVHATVVLKHEGSIEVATKPGQGARFLITLPAPRANASR